METDKIKAREAEIHSGLCHLWILQFMGIANPRSLQLIKHYGSAENVYEALHDTNPSFLKENERKRFKTASLDKSREIVEFCRKNGFHIATIAGKKYPHLLRNINNPPIVLFYVGNILLDDEVTITMVGTRTASEYSLVLTDKIAAGLAKSGIVIVSGLAHGVDKKAHDAALRFGKRTIGIAACGIDVDYPNGALQYRKEIVKHGGAVITELMPGSEVKPSYFQLRNRIMSGISYGTAIIEAPNKSGALITAAHALNQNRDVFIVPPRNVLASEYTETISLIRDGAIALFDHTDIINEYSDIYGYDVNFESDFKFDEKTASGNNITLKVHEPKQEKAPNPKEIDYSVYDENHLKVIECLKSGNCHRDMIINECGLTSGELDEIIFTLELDSIVESLSGGRVGLV